MAEIPEEVKALKARIAEFVREDLHPFEAEIAEHGEIDGEKLAGLISEGRVEDLPQEDIELARFSRKRDPNKVEDAIALPFPKA
jgi:hypothetical protein